MKRKFVGTRDPPILNFNEHTQHLLELWGGGARLERYDDLFPEKKNTLNQNAVFMRSFKKHYEGRVQK